MSGATETQEHALFDREIATFRARSRRSEARYEAAQRVFSGGDTRAAGHFSPYPITWRSARAVDIEDLDGNSYVDFTFNYGALVLGHGHPAVLEAAASAMHDGVSLAGPGPHQLELAEELVGRLDSADRLRFTNSGTEANMTAIRAARAFTGRDVVVKAIGGFHGTIPELDSNVRGTVMPKGVPQSPVVAVPYNDVEALTRTIGDLGSRCAAVILEPVLYSGGIIAADTEFLQTAERAAHDVGALFVLDEVATFRLAAGGAQSIYGLRPDMTTVGKMIGGGFPVGAVAGRADVLDVYDPRRPDAIFHSGTFIGNPVTCAAGRATLDLLGPDAYEHLSRTGSRLADGFRAALDDTGVVGQVTNVGSLVNVHFTAEPLLDADAPKTADARARTFFHICMMNRGVFGAARGLFLTSLATQDEHVDLAVAAAHDTLTQLAAAS